MKMWMAAVLAVGLAGPAWGSDDFLRQSRDRMEADSRWVQEQNRHIEQQQQMERLLREQQLMSWQQQQMLDEQRARASARQQCEAAQAWLAPAQRGVCY